MERFRFKQVHPMGKLSPSKSMVRVFRQIVATGYLARFKTVACLLSTSVSAKTKTSVMTCRTYPQYTKLKHRRRQPTESSNPFQIGSPVDHLSLSEIRVLGLLS